MAKVAATVPKHCPLCGRFLKKDNYFKFYYLDCVKDKSLGPHFTTQVFIVKGGEIVNYLTYNLGTIEIGAYFEPQLLYIWITPNNGSLSEKKFPLPDWDFNNGKSVVKKVQSLLAFI
jgi:hypothetical protein